MQYLQNAEESHCIHTSVYKFVIVVIKIFSQWSDTNKFVYYSKFLSFTELF